MEIAIAVPPLRNKLMKLLADKVITSQESIDRVIQLINMLESLPLISEDNEEKDLPRVLDFVYGAEDITDEFMLTTEVQRQKRTSQLTDRQNQKNYFDELESITLRFAATRMDLERSERSSGDQIVPTEEDTMRLENIPRNLDEASYIVGHESAIDDLVKRLLEDKTENSLVIPVVDVAGSGKTTLVRNIYNRVKIKQHFECRAWVHVSKHVSKELEERNLLADLLKQVMVNTKEQELPNKELPSKLRTFLEDKRYLIVLDGVRRLRTTDVWDCLKQALPDEKNGSRVILTTVDLDVAHRANPKSSSFQLRMPDEESWALFLNKVTGSVEQRGNPEILPSQLYLLTTKEMWPLLSKKLTAIEDDFKMPDFINLREQILRTCNGVPLAILLLGELLSTMNLIEWSRVIEHATSGKYPTTVSGILAMSYQGLRCELKSCLLYMLLFPREYEIPVRRLFRLWISENMVKPSRREERVAEDLPQIYFNEAEDLARIYFNELVGRNIIDVAKWRSDGRPKACRMPGIIYDFLLPKALKMRSLCFQDPIPSKVRRCADYLDIERYPSDVESLRSCVSFDNRQRGTPAPGIGMLLIKITGKSSSQFLTVLDLEGVYKPELPKALGKLLLLRYLGLRSTVVDSLPASVGKLQCLETLDVKDTNITSLPSSILKGKKLRHLYLNGINLDMSIVQQSSETVGDLQTLSGISIGSGGNIANGLDRFIGLRKLGLTCYSTAMEAAARWISQLTHLRTLKLRSINIMGRRSQLEFGQMMRNHNKLSHLYLLGVLPTQPNLGELLPQNLEILTLSLTELVYDPMPVLGGLHQLKTLRLLAKSYRGKQMNCNRGSFPQLRILKLWMLEELEEWRMEEGAMPCLRELEIRRCERLKKPDGLEHLATLKELILTNMPEVFVTDLKSSMGSDVFTNINDWEFSASA